MASLWARIRSAGRPQISGAQVAWGMAAFATWTPMVAWFNMHVFEVARVDGASMYPYLNEDKDATLRRDLFLNWKWSPQENLQRGMVVTLRSPYNPEKVSVKRIVGLPGDVVQTREPYPSPSATIPQGHVWVEGDGRPGTTLDSNTYGPASMRLLTGKVAYILYPFRKAGRVRWWEHQPAPIDRGA